MTRPTIAFGFAAALATLSLLRPILAVAQAAGTKSWAEPALPANQSQSPTQTEVDEALKQAQEQEGRKFALVTQALGYESACQLPETVRTPEIIEKTSQNFPRPFASFFRGTRTIEADPS